MILVEVLKMLMDLSKVPLNTWSFVRGNTALLASFFFFFFVLDNRRREKLLNELALE